MTEELKDAVGLFTKEQVPRSRKPRKLMHVYDAGDYNHVWMKCAHCGYDDGWQRKDNTLTELKRGLPCPKCN